jgi:hypothetical protein
MKKFVLGAAFLFFAASGMFAQKNTATVGMGAGVSVPFVVYTELFASYERQIIPQLAVGANMAGQFYPLATIAVAFNAKDFSNIFGFIVDAQLYWYPFAGVFHVDAAVGYSDYLRSMPCFVFAPGIGWKIKFGASGLTMNIVLRSEFFTPLGDNIFEESDQQSDLNPFNAVAARLSIGYSF